MKRLFPMILSTLLVFACLSFPVGAADSVVDLIKKPFLVDPEIIIGPFYTLDPCFKADVVLDLSNCNKYDAEYVEPPSTSPWFKQTMSCAVEFDGVDVGRLISDYVRDKVTVEGGVKVYVKISDHLAIDGFGTFFGNSANTKINHWGAKGAFTKIIDANGLPLPFELSYLYSDYDSKFRMCLFLK